MSASRYDAIVIGAGMNGLVAATALSRAGRRVAVFERQPVIGGTAQPIEFSNGYHAPLSVDRGWIPPSVASMLGDATLSSVDPEIGVSVANNGGGFTSLPCDARAAADVIRKLSQRDAERWPAFVGRLHKLAGFLGVLYQAPVPDVAATSIGDLASLVGVGRKFRALGRADMTELLRVMPMAIQDLVNDELESDVLKAAIGAGGIRDLRQGPRSGGTTFNLLHHLIGAPKGSARARSWWREGPGAGVRVAQSLAVNAGTTIETNAAVTRILISDDAVAGVVLVGGAEIEAPVVLSTLDPSQTLLGLVDPVWLDPDVLLALRNVKYRGSTAIVLFALDRLPNAPGLGAAELSSVVSLTRSIHRLERAYDDAKYGRVSDELHVEVSVPSVRWPQLAPEGKHVLVAHARYCPRHPRDGDWDRVRSRELGEAVMACITRAMPGFAETMVHYKVFTPADLEERFGLTDGALTQGELTLDQILFMRPLPGWGRHAMPVPGLYLGGAGTHPGPAVVGGAGLLAAKAVLARKAGAS